MAVAAIYPHRPARKVAPTEAVGETAGELQSKANEYVIRVWESISLSANARLASLQTQVRSLERLECNWDSYGAAPPNAIAIQNISRVLRLLGPFETTAAKVLPSAEGGAAICFVIENRYADIECTNDGGFVGVRYVGRDLPIVIEIQGTDASLQTALEQIRDHISG